MATAEKIVYPHISKDPEVCHGRACVSGTRVRVMDVAARHAQGLTPDQIATEFPSLSSPFDVYAALLYWNDHKDEIEGDLAEDDRLAEEGLAGEAEFLKKQTGR